MISVIKDFICIRFILQIREFTVTMHHCNSDHCITVTVITITVITATLQQ